MAIKDLAISYNGGVNADTALCMAVKMCKKYNAMLTGIYVSAPVHFEGKIERWISSDTLDDLQAAEDKLAGSIAKRFSPALPKPDTKARWSGCRNGDDPPRY